MKFFDLSKFKDKHKGETFVLFGSGPSLMDWDNKFCENAIKVGCNSVFMVKPDLDYYFIQDSGACSKSQKCYLNYKQLYDNYMPKLTKFYGISLRSKNRFFINDIKNFFNVLCFFTPYNFRYRAHSMIYRWALDGNAIPYKLSNRENNLMKNKHPFYELHSVIFSCAQFAMFAGAKKLIIVGCDITNNIRIGEKEEHSLYKDLNILDEWKYFIDLISSDKFEKKIEVEVFKPLGLKGLIPEFVPNT